MLEQKTIVFAAIAVIVAICNYGRKLSSEQISKLSFGELWRAMRANSVLANIVFSYRFIAIIGFTGIIGIVMGVASQVIVKLVEFDEISILWTGIQPIELVFTALGGFLGAESFERLSKIVGFGADEQKVISTVRVNDRLEHGNTEQKDKSEE